MTPGVLGTHGMEGRLSEHPPIVVSQAEGLG